MGIMNKMRERMGIILIILVLAFVVTIVVDWGGGGVGTFMGGRDHVGVVNGEKIKINEFYEIYNSILEQYRQAGMELDAQNSEMALQQAWETAVDQVLWNQEIKRLGLHISDAELFHYLENNPPEFLKNQEVFLTDGEFDRQKYLNVLYNPQGNEWLEIELYLRNNVLPYQKLNDLIMNSVLVDEQEIREAYNDEYLSYEAEYVAAPLHRIPDSLAIYSEADLQAFYQAHKETRYKQEERRNFRYVYWMKVPSARDSAAVLSDLEDFAQRHREGENFDQLAQIFSDTQDTGASGDLGWLTRENMRSQYRNAVSKGKIGDVLEPLIIGDEYHLIKINDIRKSADKEEYNLSVLVRRLDPVNTYDFYAAEAEAFLLDAESYGFSRALQDSNVPLDTVSGGFSREFPYFSQLGYFPALAKWAFRSKSESISPVFENENCYVVAELYSVEPESYLPYSEVRPSVERAVIAEKKSEISWQAIKKIQSDFVRGAIGIEEAPAQYPYIEYKQISFTLENPPYPFAAAPSFPDVIHNLQPSGISAPFRAGQYGAAFIHLLSRSEIDPEEYQIRIPYVREALLQEKQQMAYQKWIEHLRSKSDIKDYRAEFGLN
ncbi:MAG: SurA N-terminal domain-containing protein [Candidatus Marinimicrobia bacterium]|nr:SurA N-terminal domain-containing protein [Candidatus Neomarinimicrobiota bacterium]